MLLCLSLGLSRGENTKDKNRNPLEEGKVFKTTLQGVGPSLQKGVGLASQEGDKIGEDNTTIGVSFEPRTIRALGPLPNKGDAPTTKAASKKVLAHKATIVANVNFENDDDVFYEEAEEARVDRLIDSTINVITSDQVVS